MNSKLVFSLFVVLSFLVSAGTPLHNDTLGFHTTFLTWHLSNIWLFDFLFVGIVLSILLVGVYLLVRQFASQKHALFASLFVLFYKSNALLLGFFAVASLAGLAILPYLFLSFFLFETRKQWRWLATFIGLTALLAFTYGYWLLAVAILPFAELARQSIWKKSVSRQVGLTTVFVAGFSLIVVLASVLGTIHVYASGQLFGFSGLGQGILERHMEVATFVFLPAFIGLPLLGLIGYLFRHKLNALTFSLFSMTIVFTTFQAFFDYTKIALFIPYMRLVLLNSILILMLCGYGFGELYKWAASKSGKWKIFVQIAAMLFIFLNLLLSMTFFAPKEYGTIEFHKNINEYGTAYYENNPQELKALDLDSKKTLLQIYLAKWNGIVLLDTTGKNDLAGQVNLYSASPEIIAYVIANKNEVAVGQQIYYNLRKKGLQKGIEYVSNWRTCDTNKSKIVAVNIECKDLNVIGTIKEARIWG